MESIGRYRLRRLLGEGALGLVYEAAGEDGAVVAVKVLHPERAEDAAARARFLREARLAARIESRRVVPRAPLLPGRLARAAAP
jgi:serine/threonine protein kinase